MRTWFGCLLGCLACVVVFSVQASEVSFSDLARHPQYPDVKISPDGKHIAAVAVIDHLPVLALVDLETGKGAAVHPREGNEVVDFWWVNSHRVLYTVALTQGGFDRPFSTGEIFAVNADGSGADTLFGYRAGQSSVAPHISRPTTEYATATLVDTLRDDENHVLISVEAWSAGADGAFSQLFRMDVRDGVKHQVTTAPLRQAWFMTDRHGVARFAYGWNSKASRQLYYRADDSAAWSLLFTEDATHSMPWPLGFNRDDTQVYMSCEEGQAVGGVCPWDVATRKLRPPVWSNATVAPDELVESLDGRDIVGVRSLPGTPTVAALVAGADSIGVIARFSAQFPGEAVQVVSSTDDGRKAVVLVSSDADPGTFYLWDGMTRKASMLLQRAPWIRPAQMATMQPVEFKARDGLSLHGYLSMPPGQEKARHLPLVLLVHGGPIGVRDEWDYDPYVQMLATHGYAVLQVNYRGSGGYGYHFMRAGYRQWGGKMQDDLTDATRWAIAHGIGDPGRICIFGGSYGGYAALEGATSEPDLYRCAIGYVGVYDLPLMYARGDTAQSMLGESYLHEALGDDRKMLAARSPINQLDRLKAQVMLIVGGTDKRVPAVQGENLHRALLQRKIPHEWLYKPDEGHGFYSEAHRAELFSRVVAFLDRNIGPGAGAAMQH